MLTVDPLTNLDARGRDTALQTRQAVVTALLGAGDPWGRQEVAKVAWKRGDDTLARLRQQAVETSREAAEGHRRDLFDMTRRAAHAAGDPLTLQIARDSAKRVAGRVEDEDEALALVSAAVRRPNAGSGALLVTAGAVAERAHDEGWQGVVTFWATSDVGATRGGLAKVAALQYAERVTRGDEVPEGLADLPPLPEMVKSLRLPWVVLGA